MPNGAAFHIATARLTPLFAILALLMLPVDLRAGLELPHPHAIFQIILDAADGGLDHDHAALDQGYGAHHHEHDRETAMPARDGHSSDLRRVSDAGSCAESGLAATMPPMPLALSATARSPHCASPRPALLRDAAPRPPFPPPRPFA
ncbi:MAG TPA: hypothetical protein VFI22_15975 [Thermomicrobiales bacterium]|nr:hypothetical protein [Thermomicrobiales bacterium]